MLRSKFALIGFVATVAIAIGLPAHSQQRITNTPSPAAAPTPPRPEPVRSTTQQNRSAPQQNMSFNPTEQQKMEQAAKDRAAKAAARDVKATQASTKGLQGKKKEDQFDKSADAESKKLGLKEKLCRQRCSKQTGYKPSMSISGSYAATTVSFGDPMKSALYMTCVQDNCK